MKANPAFYARYRRPETSTDWAVGIDGLEHIVEIALFQEHKGLRLHMGWRDALELASALQEYALRAEQSGYHERR